MRTTLMRLTFGLAVVVVLAPAASPSGPATRSDDERAKFQFALIGDVPYSPQQELEFEKLIVEINAENRIAFTIHDGDIKSGSSPCDDSVYFREHDRFNKFEAPLIYTPGDNEWTDCHRSGFDPLERLTFLRSVMFADPSTSLGQRKLKLEFQSQDDPENARWKYGRITFATLHIVGSNNNLGRTPENDAEYAARNRANLNWLVTTFDQAATDDSAGVLLAIQANPIEANTEEPSGFDDFLAALEAEVLEFGKPVILVHGDTHYVRLDKPLRAATSRRRIERFTRVETFGAPDTHWIRGMVNVRDPEVFSFREEIVEGNLVDHRP